MIKNIKLFVNNNDESIKTAKLIKDKLSQNGFVISEDNYELAIAVGGDGSFLRMVKSNNFNSDIYYIGINSGTLGFMQEVKLDEIDKFIMELKNNLYKVEEIGIQETIVNHVLNSVQDGDIILLHDIYEPTAQAVAELVPALQERGYQIVTVSEMFQFRGITPEPGVYYRELPPVEETE